MCACFVFASAAFSLLSFFGGGVPGKPEGKPPCGGPHFLPHRRLSPFCPFLFGGLHEMEPLQQRVLAPFLPFAGNLPTVWSKKGNARG